MGIFVLVSLDIVLVGNHYQSVIKAVGQDGEPAIDFPKTLHCIASRLYVRIGSRALRSKILRSTLLSSEFLCAPDGCRKSSPEPTEKRVIQCLRPNRLGSYQCSLSVGQGIEITVMHGFSTQRAARTPLRTSAFPRF